MTTRINKKQLNRQNIMYVNEVQLLVCFTKYMNIKSEQ